MKLTIRQLRTIINESLSSDNDLIQEFKSQTRKLDNWARRITRDLLKKIDEKDFTVTEWGHKSFKVDSSYVTFLNKLRKDDEGNHEVLTFSPIVLWFTEDNNMPDRHMAIDAEIDTEELFMSVNVKANDETFFGKRDYYERSHRIFSMIRHELEHAKDIYEDGGKLSKLSNPKQEFIVYWTSPLEIRAYAMQCYSEAKRDRVTFRSMVERYVKHIFVTGKKFDFTDAELEEIAEKFRSGVNAYVKTRIDPKYHKLVDPKPSA